MSRLMSISVCPAACDASTTKSIPRSRQSRPISRTGILTPHIFDAAVDTSIPHFAVCASFERIEASISAVRSSPSGISACESKIRTFSPALSAADVGIAISDGAAIAREIADVTIAADSLRELVILKSIANGLQKRTESNYRFIMSFNSTLIVLGAMGILPPATSALLHNASTLGVSLKSMTNLLD